MKAVLLAPLLIALSPVAGSADVSPPGRPFEPSQVGLLRTIAPLGGELFGIAFSADGRLLALGCGNSVRLFETVTWRETGCLTGPEQSVFSVAFAPGGKTLAVGGFEGGVSLWDLESGNLLRTLVGHTTYVGALAWSADGASLLSGSHDGTVRIWEPSGGRARELAPHQGYVLSAAFSPDGRSAVTSGGDGSVLLWRADTWETSRKVQADSGELYVVQFVAGGRRLAGISAVAVTLWDAVSGEVLKRTPIKTPSTASARILPDGRHAVTAGVDHALRIWDLARGTEAARLAHHTADVSGISVHPSGRCFATIGADRHLKIWGPMAGGMARIRARGFCGIRVQQGAAGEVIVMDVIAGTPAALGGIAQGDVVKRIGGREISTSTDVVDQIGSFQEGEELDFIVERPSGLHTRRLKLTRRPPQVQ